jgi:hypothetical protein
MFDKMLRIEDGPDWHHFPRLYRQRIRRSTARHSAAARDSAGERGLLLPDALDHAVDCRPPRAPGAAQVAASRRASQGLPPARAARACRDRLRGRPAAFRHHVPDDRGARASAVGAGGLLHGVHIAVRRARVPRQCQRALQPLPILERAADQKFPADRHHRALRDRADRCDFRVAGAFARLLPHWPQRDDGAAHHHLPRFAARLRGEHPARRLRHAARWATGSRCPATSPTAR